MFVAFVLYRLLKGVNQTLAVLMVILAVVSVPILFLDELNHLALLTLASVSGPAAALGKAQTDALATVFLGQYHDGILVAEIFWGLWLFPLGLLVIRSGVLPRILGVVLIAAGLGWMFQSGGALLLPAFAHDISRYTSVLTAGELPFMFWLLIMGARDQLPAPPRRATPGGLGYPPDPCS
jgi:hypothetical protein